MNEESLVVLLIEDNPGDARLVRELLTSIGSLAPRFDGGMSPASSRSQVPPRADRDAVDPNVIHVDRLSAGLDELERGRVDIVLLDLNLPDSRGLDTLETVVSNAPTVPIVVLTGIQNREVGLQALDQGAQEYLVKDEVNADLLVRTIFHAIQRAEYERALERQHNRLATLYSISTFVQDISESLIDRSTPEGIKSTVCDRLAGSDLYRYAWIGEIDHDAGTVVPQSSAVPEAFFDDYPLSIADWDDPDPITKAALSEAVQVVQNTESAQGFGPWREHAQKFGYRSLAAIPIKYEEALYGILVAYSDRSIAFEKEERGILRQLGNVVGHAINAGERKAALMGDAAIELELLLSDFVSGLSESSQRSENRIEFLTTIPAGDGSYLQYAEVDGFSEESLMDLLGHRSEFRDIRRIEEGSDRQVIEVQYTEQPIISTLSTHGGHIRSASLVDGNYHITVTLPADADVRSFVGTIRESFPDVDLVAQRSVDSSSWSESSRDAIGITSLTDKQRAALEAAYFSGYFDQPRTSKGTDIADSLGITASTFHQHIQAGLRKLLASEFDDRSRSTHRP